MNKVSRLCNLIKSNPETWKKELEELRVRVKEDLPLAIFNYDVEADFTNPIVREARGIIINLESLDVVCWPFTKFCNLHEEGAKIDLANFDWDSCSCQEKVDGSIVKLYYYGESWRWATNSCISAKTATSLGGIYDFEALIKSAVNYSRIPFDSLSKDTTYIFELVTPENKLVVMYPETYLYHIGTRNNVTGEESNVDIGIKKPEVYNLHTLEDCIDACLKLNKPDTDVEKEGFVVVDKYYHRVKLKSPEYLMRHRLVDVGRLSKTRILQLMRNGISVEELVEQDPSREVYYRYYAFKMAELEFNIKRYILYVRGLYEELGENRKAVADVIKKDRYAPFGFESISKKDFNVKKRLSEIPDSGYSTMIADYIMENVFSKK